jgi:hypothetical protein
LARGLVVALAAGRAPVRAAGFATVRVALAAGFAIVRGAGFLATAFFGAAFVTFLAGAALRAAGLVAVARVGALRAAGFFAGAAFFAGADLRAGGALAADLPVAFAVVFDMVFAGAFFATAGLRAAVVGRAFGAARRVDARIAMGWARVDVVSSSFTR